MLMLGFPGLIISHLDSQVKFHMFTLLSGRHIGIPRVFILGLYISATHFDKYLTFGETLRLKTWRSVLFIVFYNITISYLLPLEVFDLSLFVLLRSG